MRQDTADFKNKRTAVSNSLEYGTINGVFFEQCAKCHDERTIADHRIEEKCANRKWQLRTAVVVFRCRKVGCAGIRKLFKPSPSILCPTQPLFSYLPIIQQRRIEHHKHRTDIMNQCAGNGIQHAEDAQGDGYEVDYHRQRDVELDAAHNGVGKAFEIRQAAEVFFVLFKITSQLSHIF